MCCFTYIKNLLSTEAQIFCFFWNPKTLPFMNLAIVYHAGHGARVSGQNYLLPIDNNRIREENDLKSHANSTTL